MKPFMKWIFNWILIIISIIIMMMNTVLRYSAVGFVINELFCCMAMIIMLQTVIKPCIVIILNINIIINYSKVMILVWTKSYWQITTSLCASNTAWFFICYKCYVDIIAQLIIQYMRLCIICSTFTPLHEVGLV